MPRSKKAVSITLSPSKAGYVLERALADRKLSQADVNRYVANMTDEIRELEERLASLRDAIVEPVKRFAHKVEEKVLGGDTPAVTKTRRKQRAVSPEVAATRRLQGQYMSLLSRIPKSKRAFYQKIAKAKGREEAIAAMRKTLEK
jgi:predicted  nucleic acid-binding Zn-ribbon protein